jgi:hypothetical protein
MLMVRSIEHGSIQQQGNDMELPRLSKAGVKGRKQEIYIRPFLLHTLTKQKKQSHPARFKSQPYINVNVPFTPLTPLQGIL